MFVIDFLRTSGAPFDQPSEKWDNPTMTLTADSKKRVVLPGVAPGDVFTYERKGAEIRLRRIYRDVPRKKVTKAQALKAIRSWKFKPAMSWDKLRTLTREP
jgi:hypothetical protein